MSEGINIADLVAITIGALAVIATIVLTTIGLVVASDLAATKRGFLELKATLDLEKRRLYGLRASSVTLGKFVSDSYSAVDVMRRAVENMMTSSWPNEPGRIRAFNLSIERPLERLARLQAYLTLLDPHEDSPLESQLESLCAKFPDLETVRSLDDLAQILPDTESALCKGYARQLRIKVEGYDSRRWTGLAA